MEAIKVTEEEVREAENSLDPRVREILAKVVERLLSERPPNAYDILEQLVISAKNDENVSEAPMPKIPLENAKLLQSLYNPEEEEVKQMNSEWMDKSPQVMPWTNCMEQLTLLKRFAGIQIPDETVLLLSLSMQRLQQQFPNIYRLRFWGCICFKWFVLEAELTPQGFAARADQMKAAAKEAQDAAKAAWEEKKKEAEEAGQPLPEPLVFLEPEIPIEPPGTGVNSMVYLVSNSPGHPESWIWLPDLTPDDIMTARQTVQFPEDIEGVSKVCGLSKKLILRAQIARITSSTRVAPQGLFKMKKKLAPGEEEEEDDDDEDEEDEDDEEEDEEPKEARMNPRFKSPPLQQLMDQTKWVHITPFILQSQARVKWWNPNPDADDEDEDEDEDEDGPKKPGPEKSPKPLSPIAQDQASPELALGFPTCWALRKNSVLGPPAVVARSLIWPGSITLFYSGRMEHVYIGWGVKTSSSHFCPKLVPELMVEPAELVLAKDPTVEEEKAAEAQDGEEEEEEDD